MARVRPESESPERPRADDLFVDPPEGRRLFDDLARRRLGISGDEFIRRYDAGDYRDIPDDLAHRDIIDLALLIPFGRQNP